MIEVKISGERSLMDVVARRLDAMPGVRHVVLSPATREGTAVVRADANAGAVDSLLGDLRAHDVPPGDVVLTRVEQIGSAVRGPSAGLVWADVLGLAGSNARIVARYLAFMVVAGVVGCYGVLDRNPLLVVGAMAISPDLLPITAAAVALVGRDARLASRALLTLAVGMAVAAAAAALFTWAQDALDIIPAGFNLDDTVLHGLASVSDETVVVAFAAGVAGMLALETRAGSGVGVAISVTTIPAAAYFGVALGLGAAQQASGALAVLGTNVLMLVLAAWLTLVVQRRRARAAER